MSGTNSSVIVQGSNIHLEGAYSGHTSGIINSTSSFVGTLGYRIKTSYYSQRGDSGGTMWVPYYHAGTGNYYRYIVGIHNGSYNSTSGTREGAYGSRIDLIISNLGITYYAG